jgi:hypothetical protein
VSFDIGPPCFLFSAVSQRVPGLEALHILTIFTSHLVCAPLFHPSLPIPLSSRFPSYIAPLWTYYCSVSVAICRQPSVAIRVPSCAHRQGAVQ